MSELPTIGIEIELPWRTMLARVDTDAAQMLSDSSGFYALSQVDRDRVQQGFDSVDERYQDLVQSVFGKDIERRSDGYTEFAFTPKRRHDDIVAVADDLFKKGILSEEEVYPLHVTLGGIPARHSSWLILMAAELSGGASSERMVQTGTWSQKGQAGIRQRGARELQLGQKVAIELRTLEANGLDQLESTLAVCQRAGGLLLDKLAGKADAATGWRDLREALMQQAERKDIDARTRWKNPHIDIAPWMLLANALEDDEWVAAVRGDVSAILL